MVRNILLLPMLVLATVLGAGCERAPSASTPAEPAGQVPQPTRFVVYGADRTGSYQDMTRTALETALRVLGTARPGDELIYRWVSDRSYAVDQVFAHVKLPVLPRPSANPFDPKAKRQRLFAEKKTLLIKRQWAARIHKLQPGPTRSTDIYGFVAAAADHFAHAPHNAHKELIIATDLNDNRGYQVQPDLSGVEVIIYPIKNENDPALMQKKKDKWAAFFKNSGVSDVMFVTAEVIR